MSSDLPQSSATTQSEEATRVELEAARYALTRRLLPVLRHHMVVHLQPIGMIYEVLYRKLAAGPGDVAPIQEGLTKINHLARSAIGSSLDVVGWLSPDAAAATSLGDGVNGCLDMVRGSFTFRGFSLDNTIRDAPLQVSQPALREVFTAALIATTDSASGPIEIILSAQLSANQAVVSVHTRPGMGSGFASDLAYRALQWRDVQALAQAHGVQLTLQGPDVHMVFAASA